MIDAPRLRGSLFPGAVIVASLIAAAIGFVLCFGVHLAYLTSHGSAWGSAAGRLRTQWVVGRGLTIIAGLVFVAVLVRTIGGDDASPKAKWWVLVSAIGLIGIAFDLGILGLTP